MGRDRDGLGRHTGDAMGLQSSCGQKAMRGSGMEPYLPADGRLSGSGMLRDTPEQQPQLSYHARGEILANT